MYDGTVSLYVMDPKDPVLGMYERAFPGVFKDLSELSADLKATCGTQKTCSEFNRLSMKPSI